MNFRKAFNNDFETLVEIRIRAMRPSLENLNRFDPDRAKERFKRSFVAKRTTVVTDGNILGFYMITENKKEIILNHLYVDPNFQNRGIGSVMINRVKDLTISVKKRISLEALKESLSNGFYQSHGFIQIGETEFDNIYGWSPTTFNEE